jgi:hypothetical protein
MSLPWLFKKQIEDIMEEGVKNYFSGKAQNDKDFNKIGMPTSRDSHVSFFIAMCGTIIVGNFIEMYHRQPSDEENDEIWLSYKPYVTEFLAKYDSLKE